MLVGFGVFVDFGVGGADGFGTGVCVGLGLGVAVGLGDGVAVAVTVTSVVDALVISGVNVSVGTIASVGNTSETGSSVIAVLRISVTVNTTSFVGVGV